MTRDEIVNALRCCADIDGEFECSQTCAFFKTSDELGDCCTKKNVAAADLIENQQRHIEALMKANNSLKDAIARRDKQIEDMAKAVTVQALDGCEYCKEYEDLPEYFISGKPVGRVFDTCIQPNENGLWHLEVPCGADIGIRFCPMCGRELPQPPKGE